MTNFLRGTNLYLIGMMGAGKTSVGKLLAQRLEYRFFDTDVLIERVTGRSIPDIFQTQGETEFRNLETQVLAELAACTRSVIATGGGIILRRQNWSYLQQGIVVWLNVAIEQLQQRLQNDSSRPLLQGTDSALTLKHLLSDRQPLYAQADLQLQVTAAETPVQVVDHLMQELPKILKPPATPPEF